MAALNYFARYDLSACLVFLLISPLAAVLRFVSVALLSVALAGLFVVAVSLSTPQLFFGDGYD